jgi:alkanesulfonate monooxygenase SsuD/methylene tetrahydromethanopterin reductase-like flavin-dependent oxidoreductase (luciferase family)
MSRNWGSTGSVVSGHHYSPRILTPSLPIAAAYIASHVHNIKIALLGPIVPQSNPVLLAEEMAMLDTMAEGRLIVGMLRGTTNEMLTYDLNPEESRERTDEGMEASWYSSSISPSRHTDLK